jgi:hypothetical protein
MQITRFSLLLRLCQAGVAGYFLVGTTTSFADDLVTRKLYCITDGSAGVDTQPSGKRAVTESERSFFVTLRLPRSGEGWGDLNVEGGAIAGLPGFAFNTRDGTRFSSAIPGIAVFRLSPTNQFAAAWVDEVAGSDDTLGYVIKGKCTEVPNN